MALASVARLRSDLVLLEATGLQVEALVVDRYYRNNGIGGKSGPAACRIGRNFLDQVLAKLHMQLQTKYVLRACASNARAGLAGARACKSLCTKGSAMEVVKGLEVGLSFDVE